MKTSANSESAMGRTCFPRNLIHWFQSISIKKQLLRRARAMRIRMVIRSVDGDKISRPADADLIVKQEDQVQSLVEEMRLLVTTQKSQMEHFGLLAEKFQKLMDDIETSLLHSSKRAGPEDGKAFRSMPSDEGRSFNGAGPSENGLESSEDYNHTDDMNVQKMKEAKILENLPPSSDTGRHGGRQKPDDAFIGGMTVARYKPAWSEHFQFLAAVKVEGEVTCLHILPHEGEDGLSKYVAAGVNTGRLYIFLSHGDLLVDFQTASNVPITTILSFSVRSNETSILTGHSDGSVLLHKLLEMRHSIPSLGDEWSTLSLEPVQALSIPRTPDPSIKLNIADKEAVKQHLRHGSIRILEAYKAGRLRYILVSDSEGNINVFLEDGTFYGNAKVAGVPLAFLWSPNSQRLLLLTSDGASSLDLRSLALRNAPCEGLDGSKAVFYTFDAKGRSRAYGFTDEGHMIYVVLSGDSLNFECRVRSKTMLDIGTIVTAASIKGYLLVVTPTHGFVYSTTTQAGHSFNSISVGMPRLLFVSSLDEISMLFLNGRPIERAKLPVIACNRERLAVLGFGEGYVGLYKSYLPVQTRSNFSSRNWSSTVIIIVLVLLGGWYIFWKKRDALVSMSDTDMDLAPSSTGTPSYKRPGMNTPSEALADSRRYASRTDEFPGSDGGYSAGAAQYRSPVAEPRFRTRGESPFLSSTSGEPSLRNSSLEPGFHLREPAVSTPFLSSTSGETLRESSSEPGYHLREPADSKFQAEFGAYSSRELYLKAARGSSSLHPRTQQQHLQEPNSF